MRLSRRAFLASAGAVALSRASTAWGAPDSGPAAGNERWSPVLGFMVWRIGDILEFDQQVAWVAEAGFESIGFHASRGMPGNWRGIDPADADVVERQRIRNLLARFRLGEIHAPFDAELKANTSEQVLRRLEQVLQFASDVGVSVITVHVDPPPPEAGAATAGWQRALDRLDRAAQKAQVRIGLEFFTGFPWLWQPRRDWIGATLDVGHMYFDRGPGYRAWETIGGQIRYLGDRLFHLHLHDNTGTVDHIEVGTGKVDWGDVLRALAQIGYRGSMTLELNPGRVTPEGIRRSDSYLRRRAAKG